MIIEGDNVRRALRKRADDLKNQMVTHPTYDPLEMARRVARYAAYEEAITIVDEAEKHVLGRDIRES